MDPIIKPRLLSSSVEPSDAGRGARVNASLGRWDQWKCCAHSVHVNLCTCAPLPWLRCFCLVCAQLSPDTQILGMCTVGVEEVEMFFEEDRFLKVTRWPEGGDEDG